MTTAHRPSEAPVFPGAPAVLGVPGAPGQPSAYTWNRFVWGFGSLCVDVQQEKEDGTWGWTVGDDGSSGEPSLQSAVVAIESALEAIFSALSATPAYSTPPRPTAEVTLPRGPEVCGRRYLFEGDAAHAYLCGLPKGHESPCGQESDERAPPPSAELIERLRAEVSRLEAERHDIWAAGWNARTGVHMYAEPESRNPYPKAEP